jgi:hypothetical protein
MYSGYTCAPGPSCVIAQSTPTMKSREYTPSREEYRLDGLASRGIVQRTLLTIVHGTCGAVTVSTGDHAFGVESGL